MPALKKMLPPVTLHGVENLLDADTEAFGLLRAALQRVTSHHNTERVVLFCEGRNSEGWLEFIANIHYTEGGRPFVLGCIQRRPGDEFEFHS